MTKAPNSMKGIASVVSSVSDPNGIAVNTDTVASTAESIRTINNRINEQYDVVQRAMSQLDNCWDGSAASFAIPKFKEIRSKFYQARYTVVDHYVAFLFQQIGQGYTETEEANKSLASAFK